MVEIKNGNIFLTRGDTLTLEISLTTDGSPYLIQLGDTFYLTIRKSDETVILEQTQTGSATFSIGTDDTDDIPLGKYLYSITVIFESGDRATPIANKIFELAKEGRGFGN